MTSIPDESVLISSAPEIGASSRLPLEELRALLGSVNVITDPSEMAFYSADVYRRADVDAVAVIAPGSQDELSRAVKICTQQGIAVIPRGGGLSYTGGFLPSRGDSVIVDMRRLNRVVEINTTDMYVTVECGATWKSLYEALKQKGVRTPYFGPMSGFGSTIGGALSQGSIFLGSTQYGSTASSTLGLEVVVADGSVIVTGSGGSLHRPSPFFRDYGPDLTGLFLHDCGAFGFKTQATLRLIQTPDFSGFAAFTFGSYADLLDAMSEVSRQGLASECFGADPYIWNMRLWNDDGRDFDRAIGVMKSARNWGSGLMDIVRMARTGRSALSDVQYAMNVTVDGKSQSEIDLALDEIRKIAMRKGRPVEATVPRAVRAAPFLPPNDLLGPKGLRWAPTHGIVPHSRAIHVLEGLHALFDERADLFQRNGIEWGYVVFAISTSAIIIEPMLYWPGAREIYHERMIEPAVLAKLDVYAANPQAANLVAQLRRDLSEYWMMQGCAHFQIGKTYRYLESRQAPVRRLLEELKSAVDPGGLINPGALGLG